VKNGSAKSLLLLGLVLLLSAAAVQAQRTRRGNGPQYDPASVITAVGTVEKINEYTGPGGWSGTHLTLKTQDSVLDVHLGPTSFLAHQGFTFSGGEQVEVTGSKIKYQNGDVLVARELKMKGKVLQLRDERGFPKWSRSRRNW
jgi:hypothetical protein